MSTPFTHRYGLVRRVRIHRLALDPLRSARLRAILAQKVEDSAQRRQVALASGSVEAGAGPSWPAALEQRDERG